MPVRVGTACEQVGYLVVSPPGAGPDGYQPGTRAPRHSDRHLFSGLYPADELRRILTQFAEPDSTHELAVAQMLRSQRAHQLHPASLHLPTDYLTAPPAARIPAPRLRVA